jgi:hypothetical protein
MKSKKKKSVVRRCKLSASKLQHACRRHIRPTPVVTAMETHHSSAPSIATIVKSDGLSLPHLSTWMSFTTSRSMLQKKIKTLLFAGRPQA